MSASDGLLKLTEYLNQTRRQAEAAIDVLNNRIEEMKEENETCMNMIEKLERERDHYKENFEQLRIQNSTKWKLKERDEWKSLVESVQKDRNRLQEDNQILQEELEKAHGEVAALSEELRRISLTSEYRISPPGTDTEHEASSPPLSPSGVSHRLSALGFNDTPDASSGSQHNLIRQLKNELIKAEEARYQTEMERLTQAAELERLREELHTGTSAVAHPCHAVVENTAVSIHADRPDDSGTSSATNGGVVDRIDTAPAAEAAAGPTSSANGSQIHTSSKSPLSGSWLSSFFSISEYISPASAAENHHPHQHSYNDITTSNGHSDGHSGTKEESVISSEGTVKRAKVSLPKSTTILKV